jgi:hypothetical protein
MVLLSRPKRSQTIICRRIRILEDTVLGLEARSRRLKGNNVNDDTRNAVTIRPQLPLEERMATVEKILVVLPVIAAEALLILSLFLPFVTATSYSRDDQVINLSQLGLAFFGVAPASSEGLDSGDIDAVGVLFGVAFLGLFLVTLCSIVGLAFVAYGKVSSRAARVLTTFVVLLAVGVAGAWLVIALGSTSESPWLPETASFTLVAGAILAAVVTFLPAFRSIWLRR